MAGIDKIYGTQGQYLELAKWLDDNCPDYKKYLYPENGYNKEYRPISNFRSDVDEWLKKNCPLGFVQKRLKEQYGE
jgi:hypothetical protein